MRKVTFITGNQNKADYMARLLGMPIDHRKIELEEIQSVDAKKIAEQKARYAYSVIGSPVLIEDISFECKSLNGLPGPFIKFFIESENGDEIICRMLDGFDDRSVSVRCTHVVYDGETIYHLEKVAKGVVSEHPRGERGYGWDPVFAMDGFEGKTNAELSAEDYDVFQRAHKPLDELKTLLEKLT